MGEERAEAKARGSEDMATRTPAVQKRCQFGSCAGEDGPDHRLLFFQRSVGRASE